MCVSFTSLSNNVLMWRVDFTPVVYKWMLSVKSLPFGLFPHVLARCFEVEVCQLCVHFHFISLMRLLLVVGRRGRAGGGVSGTAYHPSPYPYISSKKPFRLDPTPFPLSSSAPPPLPLSVSHQSSHTHTHTPTTPPPTPQQVFVD